MTVALVITIAVNAALVGGILGLAAACWIALRPGATRRKRSPKRIALWSTAALAIGLVGNVATARREAETIDRVDVVAPDRFDSARLPAATIHAPLGWQLSYDAQKGELRLIDVAHPLRAVLVGSHLMTDDVDARQLLASVTRIHAGKGLVADALPARRVGGLDAAGVRETEEGASSDVCTWLVKRGRRFVTVVQCVVPPGADCDGECAEALDAIAWRRPGRVSAEDLAP